MIRNEIRGNYCGTTSAMDLIVDRQCHACGTVQNRIEEVTRQIAAEERRAFECLCEEKTVREIVEEICNEGTC